MRAINPVAAREGAISFKPLRDPLTPTIFHEAWWLDAATRGSYDEVTVTSGGRTVGRLPYAYRERLGFRMLVAPGMTHFLGPAVDEGQGRPVSRNLRRGEITRELISKLPRFDCFHQQLHRDIPDALPFIQNGFSVETLFTYEVMPDSEDGLWRNMRDKTRNVIRRAQEQTELSDLDPADFCALYDANLQRRGQSFNYMFHENTLAVMEAAVGRKRGRVLAAFNERREALAAIFYVWDDQITYYMLTTRTPDAHNGVVSRLIWEAMRESAHHGRIFDFDVVGTHGSVLFYTAFGGEVRPRYVAQRMTPLYNALRSSLMKGRDVAHSIKGHVVSRLPEATLRREPAARSAQILLPHPPGVGP